MPYELKDVKDIRRKFNLTQADLAKRADVSQSLIAKVEAGILDPTYNNAQKIFRALDLLTEKHEARAEEIMTSKVVSVSPNSEIQEIIKKMKKYGISQMPVLNRENIEGYLSEAIVLNALMQGEKENKARDIMEDTPPAISKNASVTVISGLLKFYPMVLVTEKGKLLGIITKADIIKNFSSKGRIGIFGY